MNKSIYTLFVVICSAFAFVNCSGDGWDIGDGSSSGSGVTVGASTVTFPDGMYASGSLSNVDGVAIAAGDNQEVGGFVTASAQAAASFVGEAPTDTAVGREVNRAIGTLSSTLSYAYHSVISERVFSRADYGVDFIVGDYSFRTYSAMQPMTIAGEILNTIMDVTDTGFPVASSIAPTDTDFRLLMAVVDYNGYFYYLVSVVPADEYSNFGSMLSLFCSGSNVSGSSVTVTPGSNSFTGVAGSSIADFLFVIDDSGSMSDDQTALSQAGTDFGAAVSNAGLDYNIAIITTDASYYPTITNANGILDNDITSFKSLIVAGTSGSATEQGIYTSELSLQSTAHGDASDGFLTASPHNFPRTGANLSVIIISDESSQYPGTFDVTDNLFVDRTIPVHTIINQYSPGQYKDLSDNTLGYSSDITTTDANGDLTFAAIMEKIAIDAGGAASSFELTHTGVLPASIAVSVNGAAVTASSVDGFTYSATTNRISFHGTALPAGGASIAVTYNYTI